MKAVISNKIYMLVDSKLEKSLNEELTYEVPSNIPGRPIIIKNISLVNSNMAGGKKLVSIPSGRTDLIPKGYEIDDKRILNPVNIQLSDAYTLRDSQQAFVDWCDDSCVLNAKPGYGKSVTAIAAAAKLGQKTLIVVHTVALRNQWEKEIMKYTGKKPGIIGSGKFNVEPDIVIGNIQSLAKYVSEIKQLFGTVILDEMHHVSSPTFVKIINAMFARYKIGLTGTLRRKDGKHVVFQDYFSHKKMVPPEENTMKPIVEVHSAPFEIPPGNHWSERINQLTNNVNYQAYILWLADQYVKKGYKVLIVSDRVEFLKFCESMSENSSVCVTGTDDRESAHRGVMSGQFEELWGSVSIYSEGISLNPLSCIIPACAINNDVLLEQLIARINRMHPGKQWPVYADIKFQGHTGINQFKTRNTFYRLEGYKVRFVENST